MQREHVRLTMSWLTTQAGECRNCEFLVTLPDTCGLQVGEITALTHHDLELNPKPAIAVRRTCSEAGDQRVPGLAKSGTSRIVPFAGGWAHLKSRAKL